MTLRKQKRNNRYSVPKRVQDIIPVKKVFDNGLFQVGKNQFSRTYRFSDINYAVASEDDKMSMLKGYMALLNSLDTNARIKITVNNRRLNQNDFKRDILIPEKEDELQVYRDEYNRMLLSKATGGSAMIQEKYITVTVTAENEGEAGGAFERIGRNLAEHLGYLGSECEDLGAVERLQILHDFYRSGEEMFFHFELDENRKRGHSFKDYICPDCLEVNRSYLKIGERFARVLFLKEYASFINDDIVTKLTDWEKPLMLSTDIIPVPTTKAIRDVDRRLLGAETNITKWQRQQNANNNFSAEVPYEMELQRKQLREFLNDLRSRDQRMMLALITIVHTADTLEELNRDTKAIQAVGQEALCQISPLNFQQIDGLATAIPVGVKQIDITRTLTTESMTAFVPFRVQEIRHEHGIYYGQNVKSNNMIIADRRKLLNGNSFILGVSGSGKSFAERVRSSTICWQRMQILLSSIRSGSTRLLSGLWAEKWLKFRRSATVISMPWISTESTERSIPLLRNPSFSSLSVNRLLRGIILSKDSSRLLTAVQKMYTGIIFRATIREYHRHCRIFERNC